MGGIQSGLKLEHVKPLIGHRVYVLKKDGTSIEGVLKGIQGTKLMLAPLGAESQARAQTSALLPLVLFDLLAIGTAPYASGGYYGGGYPHGYGYNYGYNYYPYGGGYYGRGWYW